MKLKKNCFFVFAGLIFNVSSLRAEWADHIVISEMAYGEPCCGRVLDSNDMI